MIKNKTISAKLIVEDIGGNRKFICRLEAYEEETVKTMALVMIKAEENNLDRLEEVFQERDGVDYEELSLELFGRPLMFAIGDNFALVFKDKTFMETSEGWELL